MTNEHFENIINKCYESILQRKADSDGLKTYKSFLKKGKSEEDLIRVLKESDEYKNMQQININTDLYTGVINTKLSVYKNITLFINKDVKDLILYIINEYENLPNKIIHMKEYNEALLNKLYLLNELHVYDEHYIIPKKYICKKTLIEYKQLYSSMIFIKINIEDVFQNKIEDFKLIVARYNENINWTKTIQNCLIYNKGKEDIVSNHTIKLLENIGREGETYLNHIINNYDNLDDYTIFCQGDPFEHAPTLVNILEKYSKNFNDFQPLSYQWKNIKNLDEQFISKNIEGIPPEKIKSESNYLNFSDKDKIHIEYLNEDFECIFPGKWTDAGFNECLIPRLKSKQKIKGTVFNWLKNRFSKFETFVNDDYIYIPFNYSALFGVKKENIHKHSKELYVELRKFLLEDSDHGYILERLWFYLLS